MHRGDCSQTTEVAAAAAAGAARREIAGGETLDSLDTPKSCVASHTQSELNE